VDHESARNAFAHIEHIRTRLAKASTRVSDEFNGDAKDLAPSRPPTPAAVLVPLVLRDEAPSVLLTRRTDHLHHHPGQISFPGGRVEADDRSAVHTALRETEEEIGLASRHVELIGALPDYLTGTGFRVTPVVGLVRPPFDLRLDAFEVAEAFEVPLAHFLDARNHQEHSIMHEGRLRRFHAMPYHGYFIWGATAGIIMSLYRLLDDER
jgi:8-oxo-dGTP pyrophosphatase MutT (NUDIX family)